MITKNDTTTRKEVVDKLEKLKDTIDRRGAEIIDDEATTIRGADRIEALVIANIERIDFVIDLLEEYQDDVWPDIYPPVVTVGMCPGCGGKRKQLVGCEHCGCK